MILDWSNWGAAIVCMGFKAWRELTLWLSLHACTLIVAYHNVRVKFHWFYKTLLAVPLKVLVVLVMFSSFRYFYQFLRILQFSIFLRFFSY